MPDTNERMPRKTYIVTIKNSAGEIRTIEVAGKSYNDAVQNIGAHTVTSDTVLSCFAKLPESK